MQKVQGATEGAAYQKVLQQLTDTQQHLKDVQSQLAASKEREAILVSEWARARTGLKAPSKVRKSFNFPEESPEIERD
jgi:hypothetical protein